MLLLFMILFRQLLLLSVFVVVVVDVLFLLLITEIYLLNFTKNDFDINGVFLGFVVFDVFDVVFLFVFDLRNIPLMYSQNLVKN